MMSFSVTSADDLEALAQAADRAVRAIPPAWPLNSSVAVNPFLGQSGEGLAVAAARLGRVAGAGVTLPRAWFRDQLAQGLMSEPDLAAAWAAAPAALRPPSLEALKARLDAPEPLVQALPTIADLAAKVSGIDWPGLVAERIGAWAAGYLDQGQAPWAAPRGRSAYAAWRAVATHDLTPEIAGLANFAQFVSEAPEAPIAVLARAKQRLGLRGRALETYFHQLLISLGGWAQYARYLHFVAERDGGRDETLTDFLAIRLLWEDALHERYGARIEAAWHDVRLAHAAPVTATADTVLAEILQGALERSAQRELGRILAQAHPAVADIRPDMQAVFCIDVRSEVFRRSLESVAPNVKTHGFAGFFGLPLAHRRFASDTVEAHLPVLLRPGLASRASGEAPSHDQAARFRARASRAWGRFKQAAVASFAFVEASGPIYAGKLFKGALGWGEGAAPIEPPPRLDPELGRAERAQIAETILRAMSLTSGFARLVLLVGHGAGVVNNPHASGLHCGACGGYSGEVNARLLASLLNDPLVRSDLGPRGIDIGADTLFVGALHDTTSDQVMLYDADGDARAHQPDLTQTRVWLEAAGRLARAERALRLPQARGEASLRRRGHDWAQTRPEWGLAGCQAFIAAPRARTTGRSLEGRAFLHDYDWRSDPAFKVLELILTAPVVVASWISLQYYGSTVAPAVFGAGDKVLHNVVGGIGVVEGNGGPMRAGLAWQSVHDGRDYVHKPLRLSVCIEAPREAITDILNRHEGVRALFDNQWMNLFALDETGRMAWRYAGERGWLAVEPEPSGAASRRLAAAA